MKRVPPDHLNFKVHRERDGRSFSRLTLLLCCGLFLAGGFIFAARQHFAAVRYGYQSEELRRERGKLLEEQRRLLLAREQAANPSRLETAARAICMQPVQSAQLDPPKGSERNGAHQMPAPVNPSASLRR